MVTADDIYVWAIAVIVAVVVATASLDLWLWVEGHDTISDWLRRNPKWFWIPAVVAVAFLVLLGLHLWG